MCGGGRRTSQPALRYAHEGMRYSFYPISVMKRHRSDARVDRDATRMTIARRTSALRDLDIKIVAK
jgi:hypothetical protein